MPPLPGLEDSPSTQTHGFAMGYMIAPFAGFLSP